MAENCGFNTTIKNNFNTAILNQWKVYLLLIKIGLCGT